MHDLSLEQWPGMSHGRSPAVAKAEAMEKKLYSGWNTGAHAQTSGIHRGMETKADTRAGHLDAGGGQWMQTRNGFQHVEREVPRQHDIGIEFSLS